MTQAELITWVKAQPPNKRAAAIAWELAMEGNKIARVMDLLRETKTGYPKIKYQLFRLFYSIIFLHVEDGPIKIEEELLEMLKPGQPINYGPD